MNVISKILLRVLVNHFYQVNSGLFLFIFFILFGLPQQPYSFHLALITGIIHSQIFLAFVMLLWLLYNIKCVDYIVKQLHEPRLAFLSCLNNISLKKRFRYLFYVQILIYLPILLYALLIIIIAIRHERWLYVFEVIAFNIALVSLSVYIYVSALEKKRLLPVILFPSVPVRFTKPLFLILLLQLWHSRKQMLLITKAFSLLILWVFMFTYEPVKYDIRPLMLCMLLCAIAHSAVVVQIRSFDEEYLSFTKNLPITSLSRFITLVSAFFIILLPELMFIWKGYGIHFLLIDYPHLFLMVIAVMCFFYSILLLEHTTMEQFIPVVFWISIACFFILLYNPGILFSIVILLLSYALFVSYLYHYEKKIDRLKE